MISLLTTRLMHSATEDKVDEAFSTNSPQHVRGQRRTRQGHDGETEEMQASNHQMQQ